MGYGNSHDAILMKKIAAIRDGGYFFIEKLTDVYDAFLHIYGSLSTNYEVNINLELHKIKQKNKENPQLNNESIKHMLKTINKYMNYSKWKDAYEIVFVKEIKQC